MSELTKISAIKKQETGNEDEDEESNPFRAASSDGQTIQLKEDAISFDQVSSRSHMYSCGVVVTKLSSGSTYSAAECLAHGACLKTQNCNTIPI